MSNLSVTWMLLLSFRKVKGKSNHGDAGGDVNRHWSTHFEELPSLEMLRTLSSLVSVVCLLSCPLVSTGS